MAYKKYRTRIKHIHQQWVTKGKRDANRILCKRFPFLIPRNVFTDKVAWDIKPREKAYSWTLANDIPTGWWKAFGLQMCEEIREELIRWKYLCKFRFSQIKEKYGSLRMYTFGIPKDCKVNDIIDDYSRLSKNICIICGKPDVPMINYHGWWSPYCEDCYNKMENKRAKWYKEHNLKYEIKPYSSYLEDDEDPRMADERTVRCYMDGESKVVKYDIREKAEKIRENWKKRKQIVSK